MLHAELIRNEATALDHTPAPGLLLRRNCDCGQHTLGRRSCDECSKRSFTPSSAAVATAGANTFAGHDLTSVRSHPSQSARDGVHINGPDAGSGSGAPPARPQPPPARAATCPADIQVGHVDVVNDTDFGKTGPITGWGGFARMEVSDPAGRDWRDTEIHESLTRVKNTCGNDGNNACSNTSGEGGRRGSAFKVGQASKFFNFFDLPATRNSFYDLHVFADKTKSLLHTIDKQSCEVQCEQNYTCGGARLGPTFLITYSMTRDSIPRRPEGFNAVTRVSIAKAAKP